MPLILVTFCWNIFSLDTTPTSVLRHQAGLSCRLIFRNKHPHRQARGSAWGGLWSQQSSRVLHRCTAQPVCCSLRSKWWRAVPLALQPGDPRSKDPICQCRGWKRTGFDPWVEKIPCRREWQPTPVFLPGEFHGQRSLGHYIVHGVSKSRTPTEAVSKQARLFKRRETVHFQCILGYLLSRIMTRTPVCTIATKVQKQQQFRFSQSEND